MEKRKPIKFVSKHQRVKLFGYSPCFSKKFHLCRFLSCFVTLLSRTLLLNPFLSIQSDRNSSASLSLCMQIQISIIYRCHGLQNCVSSSLYTQRIMTVLAKHNDDDAIRRVSLLLNWLPEHSIDHWKSPLISTFWCQIKPSIKPQHVEWCRHHQILH